MQNNLAIQTIIVNSFFENECFLNANFKYKFVLQILVSLSVKNQKIIGIKERQEMTKDGEVCITLRELVDICNQKIRFKEEKVDKNTVERALKYWKKSGFIKSEVRQRKSFITITIPEFYEIIEVLKNTKRDKSETNLNQEVRQTSRQVRQTQPLVKSKSYEHKSNSSETRSETNPPSEVRQTLQNGGIAREDNIYINNIINLSNKGLIDKCARVRVGCGKVHKSVDESQVKTQPIEYDRRIHLRATHPQRGEELFSMEETKSQLLDRGYQIKDICRAITRFQYAEPVIKCSIVDYLDKIIENELIKQNNPKQFKTKREEVKQYPIIPEPIRHQEMQKMAVNQGCTESPMAKFAKELRAQGLY